MVDRVTAPAEEGLSVPKTDNVEIERPGWLPENFKDTEDLWKSYQELRKDHTKKSQELAEVRKSKPEDDWKATDENGMADQKEQPEEKTEPKKDQQEKPVDMDQAKQLLPGFSEDEISEISNYAWENGELTDEHYAKLEKAGYNRAIVDQFMQGQFAVVEGQRNALINAGGGEERVTHMFQWAAQNLPKAEVDAFNSKFDAGGADALLAMETLVSKYERSGVAIGPSIMQGANAAGGDTSTFKSTAQVVAAIQDPRYQTDPAYRREVEQKIARSQVL